MLQRAITGAIFISVLIGSILFSPYTFGILFFLITTLGLWEFYSLAQKANYFPQRIAGLLLGALVFISAYFAFTPGLEYIAVTCAISFLPISFAIFLFELFRKKENPFGNIAFTLLGVFYVAVPFAMLSVIVMGHPVYKPTILLGIFFILWSSDTGAYLAGKAFGKHKLFERISPGKTWEGSIGGGIIAVIIAYVVSIFYTEHRTIDWVIIALIIVVFGGLGDLAQSLLKRSVNVKDSGTLLPGHGGILDRFDSLIMSIPFIFTYTFFISKYL